MEEGVGGVGHSMWHWENSCVEVCCISRSRPLTRGCALENALCSLLFQVRTSLNRDSSQHCSLQHGGEDFRGEDGGNWVETRTFAVESVLRKSKHLEIQQEAGRARRPPQLRPHRTLLLLQPLAVQPIALGLPLGSMWVLPFLP